MEPEMIVESHQQAHAAPASSALKSTIAGAFAFAGVAILAVVAVMWVVAKKYVPAVIDEESAFMDPTSSEIIA